MTSSYGNIFRVAGPLCGEFIGHRWISHTKASDTELWCFLWSRPAPRVEQTIETPMIWNASRSLWRHCNDNLAPIYQISFLRYSWRVVWHPPSWALLYIQAEVLPYRKYQNMILAGLPKKLKRAPNRISRVPSVTEAVAAAVAADQVSLMNQLRHGNMYRQTSNIIRT